jgi:hypothetical protein
MTFAFLPYLTPHDKLFHQSQAMVDRLYLKATAVYNQTLTNPLNPGGYQDSFDDAELRIFGGHTVVSQIDCHKSPAPKPPLIDVSNEDMDNSNIPPPDVGPGFTNSRSSNNWNIPFGPTGMSEDPLMLANNPKSSEYTTGTYDPSSQDPFGVHPGDNSYDNYHHDILWANLIASIDPSSVTAHTDESQLIDDYWTSLMRDAGVLDNFPAP